MREISFTLQVLSFVKKQYIFFLRWWKTCIKFLTLPFTSVSILREILILCVFYEYSKYNVS